MTDQEHKEFSDIADELIAASELCQDECGEWWAMLAGMWPAVLDGASSEFQSAYLSELRDEHKRFKDDFEIVEETKTQTVTYRTVEFIG